MPPWKIQEPEIPLMQPLFTVQQAWTSKSLQNWAWFLNVLEMKSYSKGLCSEVTLLHFISKFYRPGTIDYGGTHHAQIRVKIKSIMYLYVKHFAYEP